MIFSITNEVANWEFTTTRVFNSARAKILFYNFNTTDKLLDKYLRQNLKIDLRSACIYLLTNCKMYKNKDNTITVKFISKKADLLAALITYGNRQVKGSEILSIAFGRKEKNKQKIERSL